MAARHGGRFRRARCSSAAAEQQHAAAPTEAPQPQAPLDALAAAGPLLLRDVRVVLVAPKTPSNVGAVARACANFEAVDLWVVAPRCDPREGEAYKVASGGGAVLDGLRVAGALSEALADTTGSVGFTRRAGRTRLTHVSIGTMLRDFPGSVPGMAAPAHWQQAGQQQPGQQQQQQQQQAEEVWSSVASHGKTALVFGREESGLTEDELRLCTHACAIPSGRVQPSLNLSHAVGVVLATLFERRLAALGLDELPVGQDLAADTKPQPGLQAAAASELEALLAKAAAVARAVGLSDQESYGGGNQGNHGRRRLPLGHIRAIMARAKPTTWEVRSLHGLASAVLKALGADGGYSSGGGSGGSSDSESTGPGGDGDGGGSSKGGSP